MAGRSDKKSNDPQQSKSYDEFSDEAEGFEEDVPSLDPKAAKAAANSGGKSRDWRDVERYREQRELKRIVGDELDNLLDELSSPKSGKPRRP